MNRPKKRLPLHPARTVLPPPLGDWADEMLGAALPAEPIATCNACVMLPEAGQPMDEQHFNPATKCCAYIPTLHNYLVGRILDEPDPAMAEGGARVAKSIAERVGVTPLGIVPPSHFRDLYGVDRFGRSETLRCPYYIVERGHCGVWKHRNAVCSTWFCKHEHGAAARNFWKAIEGALRAAEVAVVKHAVLELDVGADSLAMLFPHGLDEKRSTNAGDLDRRVDAERYARVWGKWLGRERAFYQRAARIAAGLSWNDVARLGGSELAARIEVARNALSSLTDDKLPLRLRPATFTIASMTETMTRVETYTPFDPLDLPNQLVAVLHRFNGASTKQALATIRDDDGLDIDPALVRKLVSFGVLLAD